MKIKMFAISLLTAVTAAPLAAHADYSVTDEIRVLQGFQAGGGSDALAQLAHPYLREILGVNFINEYIPGATGAIAWTRLAHQSPKDGAVISITNTPMLMTNYIINDSITYNIDQLTPIANVVTDPGADSLRPLAVFAEERLPMLPDVPTLKEIGYDVVNGSSRGYSAPAGIPDQARDELIAAFEELATHEEFLQRAEERAFYIDIVTGDDYMDMMKTMEETFTGIWSEMDEEV
ncbi:unnamed protein product [Ectocarpus sp. 12 AP-2014]